jgi:leucyl-tRNA---protein transferase
VYEKIEWITPKSPADIPVIPAALSPQEYEDLLAQGWWHMEAALWRIMYDFEWSDWGNRRLVKHLRYNLQNFRFSKSQRKLFSLNSDLQYVIQPLEYITDEKHILFVKHSQRFSKRAPHSILEMTPRWTAAPNMSWECLIFKGNELIACSFFDMTINATASIYGMFDPDEAHRSLGILTMCLELQHAILNGHRYYYPGYAFDTPSHFDYKKQFHNTEYFNWETSRWTPTGRSLANRTGFVKNANAEDWEKLT